MTVKVLSALILCLGCDQGGGATDAGGEGPPADAHAAMDGSTTVDSSARLDVAMNDAGLPSADLGPALDTVDAEASPEDVGDAGQPNVGDTLSPLCPLSEGLFVSWSHPSGRNDQICHGFSAGPWTISRDCIPQYTFGHAEVIGMEYRVYFEALPGFFDRVGPARAGFVIDEPGRECGTSDPACRYVRRDWQCAMEVTRAGGVGQLVEARLTAPCELVHDPSSRPHSRVTLTSAVIRGTFRDSSGAPALPPDAGSGSRCDGGS